MNRFMRCGLVSGLGLVVVLAGGCGEREISRPKPYPTQGKVTVGGKPLAFVGIELVPKDTKGCQALGKTGADGTFVLRTFSNDEPDGAVPAEYTVKIHPWKVGEHGGLPKGARPAKVTPNIADPGITVTIKDEDNDLDIAIP